jgi:hypothetical protein
MSRILSLFGLILVSAALLPAQEKAAAPDTKPAVGAQSPSVNDLWAEAIWLSVTADEAASEKFAAALVRAKAKAPIYVSVGDAAAVPREIHPLVEAIVASVQKAISQELQVELDFNLPDVDPNDAETVKKIFDDAVQESFRQAAANKETWKGIEGLTATFHQGATASHEYYLAALAEDPAYLPAWFRLAKSSEGELFTQAIDGFTKYDPQNALPLYLLASAQCKMDELAAALKSVQTGNQKPFCRWYPSEKPRNFKLTYPDDNLCREYSLVGQPIPEDAFLYWVDQMYRFFGLRDPLPGMLRDVSCSLTDEAKRLLKEGNRAEAVTILEAVRAMGEKLIVARPREFTFMANGIEIAWRYHDDLKQALIAAGAKKKVSALAESQQRLRHFATEFHKVMDNARPSKQELRLIFLGTKNWLEEERLRLERTLVDSGFVSLPVNQEQ